MYLSKTKSFSSRFEQSTPFQCTFPLGQSQKIAQDAGTLERPCPSSYSSEVVATLLNAMVLSDRFGSCCKPTCWGSSAFRSSFFRTTQQSVWGTHGSPTLEHHSFAWMLLVVEKHRRFNTTRPSFLAWLCRLWSWFFPATPSYPPRLNMIRLAVPWPGNCSQYFTVPNHNT